MAAKVNTRFVIILSATLVLAFAIVAGGAAYMLTQTGVRHERNGDAAMARGDYEAAAKSYAKAVNKERSNAVFLRKWQGALSKWTPATEVEYNEYYGHYMGTYRALAQVEQGNARTQGEMLAAVMRELTSRSRAEAWESLAQAADSSIQKLDQNNPETKKLLRYRGLPNLYRSRTVELPDQELASIRKDLEAAAEADPSDVEVALGRIEMMTMDAARVRRAGRVEDAASIWREALDTANKTVLRYPSDPRPMLRAWQIKADIAQQGSINPVERQQAVRALAGDLDGIVAAAQVAPKESADVQFLRNLTLTLSQAKGEEGVRQALGVLDAALASRGEDSQLMLLRGQALSQINDGAGATAQFQKVADLPPAPIGLEGKQLREDRLTALNSLIDQALTTWSQTNDASERAELIATAKNRRERLKEALGEKHALVLRADGRIAYAEGRNQEAIRLLSDLSTQMQNRDAETLFLLAAALQREGSLGAAVQQYDKVLNVDASNVGALLTSAELELRLENVDSARLRLNKVLLLDPGNEQAQRTLRLLDAATKEQAVVVEGDPVLQTLIAVRKMRAAAEPDLKGAAALLDKAMAEKPDDMRLLTERVTLYVQTGNADGAKKLLDEKIGQYPDVKVLKQFRTQLDITDPVEAQMAMIEQSQAPPLEKALQKYSTLRQAGRPEKAGELLEEAARLGPDDSRVNDLLFVTALESKQMDKARQMAARAAEKNYDGLNGLLYQARLEMAENKNEAAVGTLDRITQQSPFNAAAWRMLGQANLNVGKVDAGLEAFKRALDMRPNDGTMIRPYLAALIRVGRTSDALELARKSVARAPDDLAVQQTLLDLEEQAGDKGVAISGRRMLLNALPDDVGNMVSLARLLIDAKDYDGAQKVVERIPADEQNGSLRALLEGQVRAARGDVDGGVKIIRDFTASMKAPEGRTQMRIALANMLIQMGREQDGIAALEEARAEQDGKRMEADRRLGDLHFDRGRFDEAATAYQRVVASGGDESGAVGKRVAESMIRLERWADAEKAVAAIESKSKRDLETAMLMAEVAVGRKDQRRARGLLDEAVALAPTSHLPYLRRAQLSFNEDDQFAAVMRDLEQAMKVRPDLSLPRQMRATLLFRRGRESEALQELQAAIAARPEDDEVRMRLINELIRLKRNGDARDAITDAIKIRAAAQPAWLAQAGDLLARMGETRASVEAFSRAWDRDKTPDLLGRLVDMQLRLSPPLTAEAQKAIDSAPKEVRDGNPEMFGLLRARVLSAQNKDADAKKALAEVWAKVNDKPGGVRLWFDQADLIAKGDPAKMIEFMKTISPNFASLDPVARVMVAVRIARQQDKSPWTEAIELTEGGAESIKDQPTLAQLHRVRGQIFYLTEKYAEAAAEYERGVAIAPNDAEFLNNLAYTLGKHLNQTTKAATFAERAALIDPGNANVLDTLGWLHLRNRNLPAAEQVLRRALEQAGSDEDRLAIRVHLAQTRLEQGIKDEARTHAMEAETLMARNPVVGQAYRAELDDVNKRLRGAE